MHYFHACIFLPYDDLSGVVKVWETKCNSLLVVEHQAHGKTKRIHSHFLIETESGENWFRDEGKKILNEFMKRGNYWIATRVQKGEHAGKLIDRNLTMVYVLKGQLREKFAKNFSKEELENSRQSWVDSDKNDKTEKSPMEFHINEILKRFDKFKTYLAYDSHCDETHDDSRCSSSIILLEDIRHTTYRYLYERQGIAPQAQYYKQVASSVYLRKMESWGKLDHAIHQILNLWK